MQCELVILHQLICHHAMNKAQLNHLITAVTQKES